MLGFLNKIISLKFNNTYIKIKKWDKLKNYQRNYAKNLLMINIS